VTDEATPWHEELATVAARLEVKTKQSRWTDRTAHLIERDFVIGAYAMRKLIESHIVPAELSQSQLPVRHYDQAGRLPDPRWPDDIADSYDFEHGRRKTLSVLDLCHEIMHSSVFAYFCGETADLFDGVYVSSRISHVYLVLASDFIALCSDIAETGCTPSKFD
jgi:hypothetical protein